MRHNEGGEMIALVVANLLIAKYLRQLKEKRMKEV